ncbi:BTAD domain-containing putative transcriptional regulator, partial [Deinococcus pimensis]|uniref:BTAD domain-containing putative transcriptional regulator n=1 Tax=Deinococcus pimensis TaxID=309888 RepID=UPI000485C0B9
ALELDAAHEPATRVLMRAHYARGNLGRVLRAYEACREALGALDLRPLAETEALFRALRS